MTLREALTTTAKAPSVKAALDYLNLEEPRYGDLKQIASKHGVTSSTVCDYLRRWGIPNRLRGKQSTL